MTAERNVLIAPSLLSADFGRLADALATIEEGSGDIVHLDIMDGHFVPNLTFGPPVVEALRSRSRLPFDCHLMIEQPQRFIERFADAGADMISIHVEAEPHLQRALDAIRRAGAQAGIAINPATSLELLTDALDYCDYVLVMTVNPGFGGQSFLEPAAARIRRLRGMLDARRLPVRIEVDGGIDRSTAPRVVAAGAEILVAGSAVFGEADPADAIRKLRTAATTVET